MSDFARDTEILQDAVLGLLAAFQTYYGADIDVEPWLADKVSFAERALIATGVSLDRIIEEVGVTS